MVVADPGCTNPCPVNRLSWCQRSSISMLGVPLGQMRRPPLMLKGSCSKTSCLLSSTGSLTLTTFNRRSFFSGPLLALCGLLTLCAQRRLRNGRSRRKSSTNRSGMQLRASWLYLFQSRAGNRPVSIRLGGLGLRKIVDHADIAFSASWWESRSTCREEWSVRPDVNERLSQKQGSFKKDEEILKNSW